MADAKTPPKHKQQQLSFTPPSPSEKIPYLTRSTGTLYDEDALPPPLSETARKAQTKSALTELMLRRRGKIA